MSLSPNGPVLFGGALPCVTMATGSWRWPDLSDVAKLAVSVLASPEVVARGTRKSPTDLVRMACWSASNTTLPLASLNCEAWNFCTAAFRRGGRPCWMYELGRTSAATLVQGAAVTMYPSGVTIAPLPWKLACPLGDWAGESAR